MTSFSQYTAPLFKILLCTLLSLSMVACLASTPAQENTGEYLDNSVLTAKVKTKLLANSTIKSLPITVISYKGTVQLSGFVESREQEALAVNIAEAVPGVIAVEDHLSIKQ